MTEASSTMQCPKCGDAMNHHADKRVDPTGPREAALVDPDFDGVIQETHACPACGNVESRPASVGRRPAGRLA